MKQKFKKIISLTLINIIIIIATTIFSISLFIKNEFGNAQFEQLLFSIQFAEGTSNDVIIDGLKYCLPIVIVLVTIILFPFLKKANKATFLKVRIKRKKEFKIQLFPFKHKYLFTVIFLMILIVYSFESIGFFKYLKNQAQNSTLFEDYYVNAKDLDLKFPEEKQNLIYIYLESMEMSYTNVMIDDKETNLIPKLSKIAEENINFSNNEYLGGAYSAIGTEWTIAALVAQTSGVPLKLVINGNDYTHYSGFLPGISTLGDILKEEGYNQYFLIGSDSSFAGRDLYFKEHGDYKLLDYYWAIDENKISEDYFVFWGYEDKKLFEYAKEELLEISKEEEPFNFTILTVDTHVLDGYLDKSCKALYDYKYANAISCSDTIVSEFIEWVQKQEFYENTTIIITGDHLTMQTDIIDYLDKDNERTIYNTLINSKSTTNNLTNRTFTALDMFPTTLASLGVIIPDDRIGLGTNLFSNTKTLAEELGIDKLNSELAKKSDYYNKYFLKETYYEMITEEKARN